MKPSIWPHVVLLTAIALMTGCGKPQKPSAAGDVTGYSCLGCKAKFYVEQAVVPDFCPQCKGTGLQPLVGYVCAADGHLTLNTRRSKPFPASNAGLKPVLSVSRQRLSWRLAARSRSPAPTFAGNSDTRLHGKSRQPIVVGPIIVVKSSRRIECEDRAAGGGSGQDRAQRLATAPSVVLARYAPWEGI